MPQTLAPPIFNASRQGLVATQSATFKDDLQIVLPLYGSFQGDPVDPSSLYIDNYNNGIPVTFSLGGDTDFVPAYTSMYIDVRGQHSIIMSATDVIQINLSIYDSPQTGGSTRGLPPNGVSDPMWANVIGLWHFDANDGASIAIDSKNSGRYIGNGSTAFISNAKSQFGVGAAHNPGNVRLPALLELLNGTGDGNYGINYTWEVSVYCVNVFAVGSTQCPDGLNNISAIAGSGENYVLAAETNGANIRFVLYYVPFSGSPAANIICATPYSFALNTWYSLAVTTLGQFTLFVNGVSESVSADTSDPLLPYFYIFPNSAAYTGAGNYPGEMYADEARLTIGQRYAKNYTPEGEAFPNQ